MCDLCELNRSSDGLIITICHTCHIPLVVCREHRDWFTERERTMIHSIFPNRKIRWEMRRINDHAHCHIE